ncbi:MAG TPA: L-aspartate oxidase [Thermoanaerobaculia bacterium]|nr:L-aspartate oxidase [Thermoanaerobaculia bacterium]
MMEIHRADVVVIGAGVAGLRAVLALAPLRVVVVTKTRLGSGGSSPYAQGGIAAAIDRSDSPRLHADDTLAVGGGLNDAAVVELMTDHAPEEIERLLAAGTRFDRTAGGELALGREAGHARRRIVHAGGDATGSEMVRSLTAAVEGQPGVEILERFFAEELVVESGRVVGVVVDPGGGAPRLRLEASAVILATGGAGQLYRYTTNPPEATGDGLAMAARAGATLLDLEFVQFHPTALAAASDPLPLLTEALRGEGATLVDESGERFLTTIHPAAELAPRDVVARAIFEHRRAGHRVLLDCRRALGEGMAERFPTLYRSCRAAGFDPAREAVPVTPAAHYFMGGVMVDVRGRSSIPGLWACGEVSATGAHGANRLASNSLLEAVVFGGEAARDVLATIAGPGPGPRTAPAAAAPIASPGGAPWIDPQPTHPRRGSPPPGLPGATRRTGAWIDASPTEPRRRLRELMWERVGLIRHRAGLERALAEIDRLERELEDRPGELRNLLAAGRWVATAALQRRESRGSHLRSDHPQTDDSLERHLPLYPQPAGSAASRRAAVRAASASSG